MFSFFRKDKENKNKNDQIFKNFRSVLVLYKEGNILKSGDSNFFWLLSSLLQNLRKFDFIDDYFYRDVWENFFNYVNVSDDFSFAAIPIEYTKALKRAEEFDYAKKIVQSWIRKNPELEDYYLYNTIEYKLTDEEKTIPIDFNKLILKFLFALSGNIVKFYNTEELKENLDKIRNILKRRLGIRYLYIRVDFNLFSVSDKIENYFLERIEKINNFLNEKLNFSLKDKEEIRMSFENAIKNMAKDMKEKIREEFQTKRDKEKKIEKFELATEEFVERVPKMFIYTCTFSAKEEKFREIHEDFLNHIKIDLEEAKRKLIGSIYDIYITTNNLHYATQGSFVTFSPTIKE